jgi:dihydrofolate reductase
MAMTQHRSGMIDAFVMLTIDGFYEGPDGAFDFWKLDDDFERFSNEQLDAFDVIVFGRRTYDGMAEYWPSPDAVEHSPDMARRMNDTPKIVVSTTLTAPSWHGTTTVSSVDDLDRQRRESGSSMLVLGSPSLVGSLIDAALLDELRIMVNPVAIGAGGVFADAVTQHFDGSLRDVRRIGADNVLLAYATR